MRPYLYLSLMLLAACGVSKTDPTTVDPKMRAVVDPTPAPAPCTPGAMLCDGTQVARCAADGTTRTPVLDCSSNPVQNTCGACGTGLACVSAQPLCSGTVAGISPAPWAFSTSGCNEFQCDAALQPHSTDAGESFTLTLGGGPFRTLTVSAPDMARVFPGSPNGLVSSGPVRVQVAMTNGDTCTVFGASPPPPYSGTVTMSWTGTHRGDPVTIQIDGPLSCFSQTQTDIHAHIVTAFQ